MSKTFRLLLAAALALGSMVIVSMAHSTGLNKVDFDVASNALRGNAMKDPAKRPVTVYLPDGYSKSTARYPVVYILPGLLMFRMEESVAALVDHRRPTLAPQFAAAFGNFAFDMDGIAQRLMSTGAIPKAILVEVSGMTGYGGSWYECSPSFGDHRTFVARDVVAAVDKRFRTIRNRDGRALLGFSMGGYGALALAIEYPAVFGALGLLSPAINDVDLPPPPAAPALVSIYRILPNRTPISGLPVDKPMSPEQTAATQGTVPASPKSDGRFFAAAVWTGNQRVSFDPKAPFLAHSLLTDDSNPKSPLNQAVWRQWSATDTASRVAAGATNLHRTPVFLGRGNNNKVPFHREILDHPALITAFNTYGVQFADFQVNGDHYTSLAPPAAEGPVGTFEVGLRFVLSRLGTQKERPVTYNAALKHEHQSCAAKFPR